MAYAAQVNNPGYYKSDPLVHAVGLGDLWDTIGQIAQKVGSVAQGVASAAPYARDVVSGTKAVAIVPTGTTSTVVAGQGPVAFGLPGIPSWVVPVGIGALAFLLLRRRR